MHAILTGSRDWNSESIVSEVLERLSCSGLAYVSVGDCKTGVDAMVTRWCQDAGITPLTFIADWSRYGNSAGPKRNQTMVDAGGDICVGFVDLESRGTRDCLRKAISAGIETHALVCGRWMSGDTLKYEVQR